MGNAAGAPGTATTTTDGHTSTSSRGTRILGVATLLTGALAIAYAFGFSTADVGETKGAGLGNTVRILYVHVPTVSIAYLFMITNAIASAYYLWKRTAFPDLLAGATGEIGTVMLGLTLISGMMWGRPTWGSYWTWNDPRITSTLLLFLMYVGYVTVRNLPAAIPVRNTRSAVVGILSALLIYPVHMSTRWWSSIHQGSTFSRPGSSKIHGAQEFAFYMSFLALLLFAGWLLMHRFRVGWLADQVAASEYDEAIAERRAEGAALEGVAS
jgi:heme exporter protein C